MAYNFDKIYDFARKGFAIAPLLAFPASLFVDAPFGRFAPATNSILLFDGIKSWIVMELVSPVSFMYTYSRSPLSALSFGRPPLLTLANPANVLASLFFIHYTNRALISPLRTPSRSKSHILVPLMGSLVNIVNGSLLAAYLSSPSAIQFLSGAYRKPMFWLGVIMWTIGFVGNVVHDEILLNIRRNAKSKGKGKASSDEKGEHYAIPHGFLYTYISYPNYLCEWIEWLGFALAASPFPDVSSPSAFLATVSPPFLFFYFEVLVMFPRAWKGHQWYLRRFPDYPKSRRSVFPFIL